MQRRTKTSIKYIIVLLAVAVLISLSTYHSIADAEEYTPLEGDGWNQTADGVMTIESNRGWWNAMKHGFTVNINKLVIGKEVTEFRIYSLPYDVPSPDFFDKSDIAGYDKYGEPYYEFTWSTDIHSNVIEVETGNPVFQVVDGLLINITTGELVLSETRVKEVVIPEGVKVITRDAFSERDLISVQFPLTLESIGENAFGSCESLTYVDLPEGLKRLQLGAFSGCTALKKIELPDSLQKIGYYAFSECAIENIQIPDAVDEIGGRAFSECEKLKQVTLPAGLKTIEMSTFASCGRLVQIDLPETLESIEPQAFLYCHALRRMILPDSVQQIGDKAFCGCDLTVFRIPPKLAFLWDGGRDRGYIINPHSKQDKSFELGSVDTVILSGSDYDFGYPAIENAPNVYFLGVPPEDVGQILDEQSVGRIYCSDEFKFEWTRSKVASWVRQRLTILPAAEIAALTEEAINATPEPTEEPRPTLKPEPSKTPVPTLTPIPSATPIPTPAPTVAEAKEAFDPMLLAFAGVLALVIAGIVIVAVKGKKLRKRTKK